MSFDNPTFVDMLTDRLLVHGIGKSIYSRYVESLPFSGNETVLDLGCGSGGASRHIAQRLSEGGGRVVGLDSSEAWVNTARKRVQGYPNATFKVGDIRTADIPDASFDAVSIHFMLHDIDKGERSEIVQALSCKLKTGGMCFIREPTKESHGMPACEIRDMMSKAGLEEVESSESKSRLLGPTYAGIFRKR